MGWQVSVYGRWQGSYRFRRKRPPKSVRDALMLKQGRCCYYCDREFGSMFRWRGKVFRVSVEWDHIIPFCHVGNPIDNWVAACRKCNGLKSNLMFDSLAEARAYVRKMLRLSGVPRVCEIETEDQPQELSGMPAAIPAEAGLPEVVQPKVSHVRILEATLDYRFGPMRGYRLHPRLDPTG